MKHTNSMKAIVYYRYGSPEVLHQKQIPVPIPKSKEVLIKIQATSVTPADWRIRKADPFLARLFNGLFRPRRVHVLGIEVAGIVEAVGKEVSRFKTGDKVFGLCGLKFGGYAEYTCINETKVLDLMPSNLSFEQAATLPLGSITALHLLQKGKIQAGMKVMIYGASGSVGTYAVQLAKHFGCKVTAVCSTTNLALVKTLGADDVLDYTKTNWHQSDSRYDLIFDAVGKIKKGQVKHLLQSGGRFVTTWNQTTQTLADLHFVKQLAEQGQLVSVIDRTYRLDQIQEAHHYVEQFRKKGNVAVKVV